MAGEDGADARRALPAGDRLIRALRERRPELPAWAAAAAARATLAAAREALAAPAGRLPRLEDLIEAAAERAAALARGHPRRVVNATGVVLHTNLGRAPLAAGAAAAAAGAAAVYSDLELDLEDGGRGDRLGPVSEALRLLSGAEDALAVNNNAAALVLALNTLARGREVVVSRGELVEIGGSFRVPEILERAGAVLREVGTTNRTHPDDYRRAIRPETALLLKVHRSNFEQRGFVRDVTLAELAAIGGEHGLPVLEDLGSGSLLELPELGLPPESFAPQRLRQGADLVCFSGDKLLGGPQAGIVLGRRALVDALRRNPLARALRLDKLSLAALDWTLRALLEGRGPSELPVLAALGTPLAALEARAAALAARLEGVLRGRARLELRREHAPVGGGSLPGLERETAVLVLRAPCGAEALAAALRRAPVPVLARIRHEAVLLDLRSFLPGDEEAVEAALRAWCESASD